MVPSNAQRAGRAWRGQSGGPRAATAERRLAARRRLDCRVQSTDSPNAAGRVEPVVDELESGYQARAAVHTFLIVQQQFVSTVVDRIAALPKKHHLRLRLVGTYNLNEACY